MSRFPWPPLINSLHNILTSNSVCPHSMRLIVLKGLVPLFVSGYEISQGETFTTMTKKKQTPRLFILQLNAILLSVFSGLISNFCFSYFCFRFDVFVFIWIGFGNFQGFSWYQIRTILLAKVALKIRLLNFMQFFQKLFSWFIFPQWSQWFITLFRFIESFQT